MLKVYHFVLTMWTRHKIVLCSKQHLPAEREVTCEKGRYLKINIIIYYNNNLFNAIIMLTVPPGSILFTHTFQKAWIFFRVGIFVCCLLWERYKAFIVLTSEVSYVNYLDVFWIICGFCSFSWLNGLNEIDRYIRLLKFIWKFFEFLDDLDG